MVYVVGKTFTNELQWSGSLHSTGNPRDGAVSPRSIGLHAEEPVFFCLFLFLYFNHCRNVRSLVGRTVNAAALKGNVAAHLMILCSYKPDFLDHVGVRKMINLHSKF